MNNGDDKLVEEYLKGDSEITRLYAESDAEECPPDLREKILAQSRKEVGSKPRLISSPFVTRGLVPLAIAATVLVGVGIVNFLPQNELGPVEDPKVPSLSFRGGASIDQTTEYSTPKEWLAYIRELKEEGDLEQAEKELARFMLENSEYPIGDLDQLLEK